MSKIAENLSRLLTEAVKRARDVKRQIVYDWIPTVPLPETPSYERYIKTVDAPVLNQNKTTIEGAREQIWEAFQSPEPQKLLLVRVMPGVGKTHAAVHLAEDFAEKGYRVLYAAPRHDMFPELMRIADHPEWWMEWLPRRFGDEEKGISQTCHYEIQINEWMKKGHEAMNFCSGVCGWDFVNKSCPYHKQKKTQARIIFGQHQHVATGHPLPFDVIIGDETPLGAFPHEWRIPTKYILPGGMDSTDPLTHILHIIQSVSQNVEEKRPVFGPELIEILGGADDLLEALEAVDIPAGDIEKMSTIHNAGEVEAAPYFHLFDFARLLKREAELYKAGNDYPHRIYILNGELVLLLRHTPRNLPETVIWLDATGNERIYEALFGRKMRVIDATVERMGKIIQVVDRAWGKRATENKGDQLDMLVQEIARRYDKPSVIGFKKFIERYKDTEIKAGNFYGARGTNEHIDADCVIVAGTPQANIYSLVWVAKMIFFDRDKAFRVEWVVRDVTYDYIAPDGKGRAYPVPGFWFDDDLQAVLTDNREKEIMQAAHRGRPVSRANVDTWLLTSTPVIGLEPDEITTAREVVNAPDGTNLFVWMRVSRLIDTATVISISDLQAVGMHYATAMKYLKLIQEMDGWEPAVAKTDKRGQPPKVAARKPLT